MDGSASPVAMCFVEDGDVMRSMGNYTLARDRFVDVAFGDAGVSAREAIAVVEVDDMMVWLIVDER